MGVELIKTSKALAVLIISLAATAALCAFALMKVNDLTDVPVSQPASSAAPAAPSPVPESPEPTEDPDMAMYRELTETYEFTAFDGETVYTYTGYGNLNCYEKPYDDSNIVYVLTGGTQVNVDGMTGKYFLIHLGNCSYAYAEAEEFMEGEAYAETEGAVNLKKLLPGAIFTLDFSSESNITGERLIPSVPFMEEKSAEALLTAFRIFMSDGYTMQIYDTYRPVSAQYAVYSAVGDESYVENPDSRHSEHGRGRAVDFTLVDSATGLKIKTPTDVHCFIEDALLCNSEVWDEETRANVNYMAMVMETAGFKQTDTTWWHYEYAGSDAGEMNENLNFAAVKYKISE